MVIFDRRNYQTPQRSYLPLMRLAFLFPFAKLNYVITRPSITQFYSFKPMYWQILYYSETFIDVCDTLKLRNVRSRNRNYLIVN